MAGRRCRIFFVFFVLFGMLLLLMVKFCCSVFFRNLNGVIGRKVVFIMRMVERDGIIDVSGLREGYRVF